MVEMMSSATTTTRWISPSAAAAVAGVSRRTIYNWLKAGRLNWRRRVSGLIAIDEASLWAEYQGQRRPWELRQPGEVLNHAD